jgi:diguanylate cyclase (GGDEF)-like protein
LSLRVNSSLARRLHDTVGTLRLREVELEYLAFHDPLTGLANRALFADRVSHALSRTRLPHPVIVLLADLDDFKSVNDTLGHPAGDALLVAVADRLRSVVRPEDTVARLGGDEFAILLEDADGVVGAEDVATRISEALAQPLHLSGVLGTVRASIGIAAAGQSATQESLLRDADIAMYSAKAAGKGRYAFYAEALAAASVGRALLKSDLSGALARGELALKYQPIIAVASGHVTGVEALLRWHHPYQGEVLPAIFIPLAEETDAILPIGRWVITEACRQAGRWRHNLPEDAPSIQLAVNLSARQLGDPELIPTLTDALAAAGLPRASLTLEITESAMPADDDANMATVLALHSLGVKLAIDDFGTGQSSLSRLRHFPVDSLKVDRSFISELSLEAPAPDVLISAILAVGLGLGMNVIAEGVETHEQLEVLRALNCPEAQGYLFSRPAEPDVIEALIHTGIALSDPLDTRL